MKIQREHIALFILLAIQGALHLLVVNKPDFQTVFDEYYYVPAARDLLHFRVSNPEHPFLGKGWIALGMLILGDNSYGWRTPSILFGLASLVVVYYLARNFLDRRCAFSAAWLLSFDSLFFIHSNLALLEIPSIFFGVLGIHLLLRRHYSYSAVSLGLSILSKETGVFFFLTLALYYVAKNWRSLVEDTKRVTQVPLRFRSAGHFILLMLIVVLVPMQIYDLTYKPLGMTYVTNHLQYMVSYQSNLKINENDTLNAGNFPWSWVIFYPGMTYYVAPNEYISTRTILRDDQTLEQPYSVKMGYDIGWYGVGSMPLWWSFWSVLPACMYLAFKRNDAAKFTLAWITATYLPMFYISLIVDRVVYPFYFLNTLPVLAIGVTYSINRFEFIPWQKALVLGALVVAQAFYFACVYPINIF